MRCALHITGGLSPLARGTRSGERRTPGRLRFIPAGAGNTSSDPDVLSAQAVYPRWRGEHYREGVNDEQSNGLSPLARGTLQSLTADYAQGRFIPAGAGNTLSIHICF